MHSHNTTKNIALAFWINLLFSLIELIGGFISGSIAIWADSLHDFTDALALGTAWILEKKSYGQKNHQYSYGYRRLSLLSSVIVALAVLFSSAYIILVSYQKLSSPHEPQAYWMIAFSIFGLIANGIAVLKLKGGHSQNEKVITWHLLEDVLGWAVVLVGALVYKITGLAWIDPMLAILISAFVFVRISQQLKKTLHLFLQGTPDEFNLELFRQTASRISGVMNVHDVHTWSLDGVHHILSCHVQLTRSASLSDINRVKKQVRQVLQEMGHFHSTIEIELDEVCAHDCEQVKEV